MKARKESSSTPVGLRLAFASINDDTAGGGLAPQRAQVAHAGAVRMLDDLERLRNVEVMDKEIIRTAKALFRGADTDPSQELGMRAEAGFCLGFAVCWLVMTSINGTAR